MENQKPDQPPEPEAEPVEEAADAVDTPAAEVEVVRPIATSSDILDSAVQLKGRVVDVVSREADSLILNVCYNIINRCFSIFSFKGFFQILL